MKLLPSDVIDLSTWKINVATPDTPTQIEQPDLNSYSSEFFHAGTPYVRFFAPVGGGVQPGAKYPRSELREMPGNWATNVGTHSMNILQRIVHVPAVKPGVICGQIHDANELVVACVLDGNKLSINHTGSLTLIDSNYRLGDIFPLMFVAASGLIQVWYRGLMKVQFADSRPGCYFKAGAYCQSNPNKGDAPNDYAAVDIISLDVFHS